MMLLKPPFRRACRLVFLPLISASGASVCHAQTLSIDRDTALKIAVQNSVQALVARSARDAAQVRVDREKPLARPMLDLTATGTVQGAKVTLPRPNAPNATVLPEGYGRVGLSFEQVVSRPGFAVAKTRYVFQSLGLAFDYRKEISDLIFETDKAYLMALKAEAGVRLATEGVGAAQRFLELAQKQVEGGTGKPIDIEVAQTLALEALIGKRKAESGAQLARYNLFRYLGIEGMSPMQLTPVTPAQEPPTEPNISAAWQYRPELNSLEMALQATKMGGALAQLQLRPVFSLKGELSRQTATALFPSDYWAVTLEVKLPIWDGGKAKLDVREANAQTQRLTALRQMTRDGIALDVRQAWEKLRESRDNRELAAAQERLAQSQAKIAEVAYRTDIGTAIAAQEALRNVRLASERRMQAETDYEVAWSEYRYAIGDFAFVAAALISEPKTVVTPKKAPSRSEGTPK